MDLLTSYVYIGGCVIALVVGGMLVWHPPENTATRHLPWRLRIGVASLSIYCLGGTIILMSLVAVIWAALDDSVGLDGLKVIVFPFIFGLGLLVVNAVALVFFAVRRRSDLKREAATEGLAQSPSP
jgi:hypothetical protein